MSIRVGSRREVAVVKAERRLVVGNRKAFKAAVINELERGGRTIVVDLGDTDFVDSGGLGALVTLHRQAEEMGCSLLLANLSEELTSQLRLTKLDTIFTTAESVDQALLKVDGGPSPHG